MTTSSNDRIDNWQRLAQYDTNLQGELHAGLLRNNGIVVSLQVLSAIPGMNSGAVLWVQQQDYLSAQQLLASIDTQWQNSSAEHLADDEE